MNAPTIVCGSCSWPLPEESWNIHDGISCPGCHRSTIIVSFPALKLFKVGGQADKLLADTEASCFFHEQNRAEKPCDECGRFLCKLCEIALLDKIYCPQCFNSNADKGKMQQVENRRVLHDSIALSIAIIPMILIWPTIITAPVAIYWSIKHWDSPRSVLPRTRAR